jgi:acetylornithine/LysW-gamma-L-lysine aminotransferase
LNKEKIVEIEKTHSANVYHKFPLCINQGKGALVYDLNGEEYIDCMSGYGVSLIGHCHPKVINAIKEQSEKLITCHSSFYNEKRAELLEKLAKISPKNLRKIFLCNSGAESIECALKASIKFTKKQEIISMVRGYHGKTLGALSTTWNPKYKTAFKSVLYPHVKLVPFGKIQNLKNAVTTNTAAIIVEPIQGEAGVYVAPDGFLSELREICNQKKIVLIFDEIQTGFGRTGCMWASEYWNVIPDIMCVSKSMGGGLPIGATIAKEEIMDSFKIGEHTSTFGGNPLACAAASATIDVILKENLVEKAKILGDQFKKILKKLVLNYNVLREVRGLGLMLGLESKFSVYNVLLKALEKKVLLLYSGKNIIRFLPPLIINMRQLKTVSNVLKTIIEEETKSRNL